MTFHYSSCGFVVETIETVISRNLELREKTQELFSRNLDHFSG